MARRKRYSYNDRRNYHSKKMHSFTRRFQKGASFDFDAMDAAERKMPKVQYSDGFSTFTSDIERGYIMPADKLKKKSAAFQRGYQAARSAYDRSRNVKF